MPNSPLEKNGSRSFTVAILTDAQFWVPVGVALLGIALLAVLGRV